MKVAFSLIGGNWWTGGIHYMENLLSAIHDAPGHTTQPYLFTAAETGDQEIGGLLPLLAAPPIRHRAWSKGSMEGRMRLLNGLLWQRDLLAENLFRQAGINLVFQHMAWYGFGFRLPTLAWIADFQHRYLKEMFTTARYWYREIGYRALSRSATRILVSSETVRQDCEKFYPASRGKIAVLPFAVNLKPVVAQVPFDQILEKYHLPAKFFILPNQFWKHKNHLAIIEALALARADGTNLVVAVTGNPQDFRAPHYPQLVLNRVKEYRLEENFRILGMLPYAELRSLMRLSAALINPSFFEGWSTTVEEAKALGVPLLLSDLPVHREQTQGFDPDRCAYFNPRAPAEIAEVLCSYWERLPAGPRPEIERIALEDNQQRRLRFAQEFERIAQATIAAKV